MGELCSTGQRRSCGTDRARSIGQKKSANPIDYLTFVPDGEPAPDANLGRVVELLKPLRIKVAVITNSSPIWREDVRADFAEADRLFLKVNSTREKASRKVP